MNFKSLINESSGITRVTLSEQDLELASFDEICVALAKEINTQKVVLDLSGVSVMTSQEFSRVSQLSSHLRLFGARVIVCGINEMAAIMAVTFDVPVNFETAQNYDHALTQF